MADSLNDLANDMKSRAIAEIDFSDEEVQEAYNNLAEQFDASDRQELVDVARGQHSDYNDGLEEDMRAWFRDKGIREEYLSQWDSDTLRNIQYEIKQSFKELWADNPAQVNEISQVFRDANISELNKMCAKAQYSEVYSQLGEPDDAIVGRPDNFADCAELVADVKELSDTLGNMYEG